MPNEIKIICGTDNYKDFKHTIYAASARCVLNSIQFFESYFSFDDVFFIEFCAPLGL